MSEGIDETQSHDDDTSGHGHPGEHPAFPMPRPTVPGSQHDESGEVSPDPDGNS